MGLGNQGTSVSHRLCHVGMVATVAPGASTAALDGRSCFQRSGAAEVEVEGQEVGAEESGASREPSQQRTLIPAFVPSFV